MACQENGASSPWKPERHDPPPGDCRSLLLPCGLSIFFITSSIALRMLSVSAPWLGGKSTRLFRCAAMIGVAAVGAQSFWARNSRPMYWFSSESGVIFSIGSMSRFTR